MEDSSDTYQDNQKLIDNSNDAHNQADSNSLNENPPAEQRKLPQWRKACFIFLPVEICVFLFLFAVYFQMQIYQQYYFQRIVKESVMEYNNWTKQEAFYDNVSFSEMCINQEEATNLTNKTIFLHAQKKVNDISMITTLASLVPSAVVALIMTPLTDRYGRKFALVTVFFGQLLAAIVGILIVYLELSIYYFLLSSVLIGISGGFGVIMAASFSYISDITPKRWLTVRMGICEGSIFVAMAIASASADKWIDRAHCDFRPMYILIAGTILLGLIYSIIIPESVSSDDKNNTKVPRKNLTLLIRGLKIFTLPSYLGFSKLWKLWIAMGIVMIASITQVGNQEIVGYFLHNKPLQWTYDMIGNYLAVSSVSHMLALIFLLPLLVFLKVPDPIIMSVGIIFSFSGNVFIALLKKTWEMFLVGSVMGVEAVLVPGLRAFVAHLVKREDLGAAFSVVAAIQLFGIIIASIVYNLLYTPQTTQGDHLRSPKLVFWISAGLWVIGIVLIIPLVLFREKPQTEKEKSSEEETRSLLAHRDDHTIN